MILKGRSEWNCIPDMALVSVSHDWMSWASDFHIFKSRHQLIHGACFFHPFPNFQSKSQQVSLTDISHSPFLSTLLSPAIS